MTQRWYLIHTHRHHEKDVAATIEKQFNRETYLPLETKWHLHRRQERVKVPLFARFLFVRFNLETTQWWRINRYAHVDGVVCQNHKPVPIPDRQLDIVRQADHAGLYDRTWRPPEPEFEPGTPVKITSGPFVGLIAQVLRATPKQRLEILFQILGGETKMQIDRSSVEPLKFDNPGNQRYVA